MGLFIQYIQGSIFLFNFGAINIFLLWERKKNERKRKKKNGGKSKAKETKIKNFLKKIWNIFNQIKPITVNKNME